MVFYSDISTKLGDIRVFVHQNAVAGATFIPDLSDKYLAKLAKRCKCTEFTEQKTELHSLAESWFKSYFAGDAPSVELPLFFGCGKFADSVYNALVKVPFGEKTTYSALARAIESRGWRAVGSAVGSNPIIIIVPCHRVLRADGAIGNFSALEGAKTKTFLLTHEAVHS